MKSAILGGGLLGLPHVAEARTYNYEDVPLGERSFGMGHASMAYPGDVSSMFYNPATLGYIESSQMSASLSSYARIDTRTGEFVSLFKSAKDNISRGGFLAIPSTVGGNLKWGSWQWGGAILVPYMYDNSGTVNLNETDLAAFEAKFNTVWMGAFVAKSVGRHKFGASLFYASNEIDEKFSFSKESVSPQELRFVTKKVNNNGLVLILGGAHDMSEKLQFGYSLRAPIVQIGGTGQYLNLVSTAALSGDEQNFKSQFMPSPARLSGGFAWQANPRLLIAADIHFYFGMKGNYSPDRNPIFAVDAKPIANVMLGTEYFAWKTVALRTGFFTNLSSARGVPTGLSAIDDKVHMFGATAAFVFDKPTGSISLGGYIMGGQGSSMTLDETAAITPRSNYIYGFVVATTYKF